MCLHVLHNTENSHTVAAEALNDQALYDNIADRQISQTLTQKQSHPSHRQSRLKKVSFISHLVKEQKPA